MGSIKKMLLALLLATAGYAAAGQVVFSPDPDVPLDSGNVLQRFDRFLKELFPTRLYPGENVTIRLVSKGAPLSRQGEEYCINHFILEKQDLSLLSEAGGLLLFIHGKAPRDFRLPLFVCGAFRHRERGTAAEERFLSNNRKFRSVEAFSRAGFHPELHTLLNFVPGREPDSAEGAWFDDRSRLLLEMLRSSKFRGNAADISAAGAKIANGDPQKLSAALWNNFTPMPPHLARKEIDKLMEVTIPPIPEEKPAVQTKKNTAQAKKNAEAEKEKPSRRVSVFEMPVNLRNHPLRRKVCSAYAGTVLRQLKLLPPLLKPAARELHSAALKLAGDVNRESEFLAAVRRLQKELELAEKRGALLDQEELNSEKHVKLYRKVLNINSTRSSSLPPGCRTFLDRTENYYSGI